MTKHQFENNNIKPIKNLLEFSKKIFSQKYYKGKDGPINICMTISMAISEDSTWEQYLAGWNLTLNMIKKSKCESIKNIPNNDKDIILSKLKENIIEKYPIIEYHIDYYFHNHPNAPWNKNV